MNNENPLNELKNNLIKLSDEVQDFDPQDWKEYHRQCKEEDEKWDGLREDNGWGKM